MDDERARDEPLPDGPSRAEDSQCLLMLQTCTTELRQLTRDVDLAALAIDTAFSYHACIDMGDTVKALDMRTLAMYESMVGLMRTLPPPLSLAEGRGQLDWLDAFKGLQAARSRLHALLRPATPGDMT